jgi:hypothetical protein
VSENSTGGKSGAVRTVNNHFEASKSEKPQYFVYVVRTNGLKTIILSSISGDVTFLTPFITRGSL